MNVNKWRLMQINAGESGTFLVASYQVRLLVDQLFVF